MSPVSDRRAKLALCAIVATTAISLLYVSVPRTAAAFLTIMGDRILNRIQKGEAVTQEQIAEFEESRRASSRWISHGRIYFDHSSARILKRAAAKKNERQKYGEEILALARQSVRISPPNSRAWLIVAGEEARLNGDTKLMADALTMSFLTAPVLPLQLFYRLDLALASTRFRESSEQNLILRQIRIASKLMPHRMVDYSAKSLEKIALFRAALAYDPPVYNRYNRSLEQYFRSRRK